MDLMIILETRLILHQFVPSQACLFGCKAGLKDFVLFEENS